MSLFSMAQSIDLKNGLVGYYPFNGNANDESGNRNNGSVIGASLTSDRNGNPNSAYFFNGRSDYISISRFSELTSVQTKTLWINLNNIESKSNQYIIDEGGNNNWVQLYDGNTDNYLELRSGSSTSSVIDGKQKFVTKNTWYFIAITVNSSNVLKIYINGTLDVSGKIYPIKPTSITIGKFTGDCCYFNGIIDDVRFYNRALNEEEIQALYVESDKNPKLEISNLKLENPRGNNSIGTYQTANLKFNIANNGKSDAKNVEVKITETNYIKGLDFTSSKSIGDMVIGNQQEITIPVKASKGLTDGTANFSIQLIENNGFNSAKKTLNVTTKAVKSLTEEIKMYVESKVNDWQQKGEFEKSSDYKIRVNETTRAKKIEEFQLMAVNDFKKQYAESINFKDLKLGTYDADNECFLFSSSQLSEFVVPVPLAEAPAFKQNFNSLKFQGSDFFIKDDNFVLSHLEVIGVNNKKYTFDSKNKTTYALTNIDYKFAAIEVDVEDKTASNFNKIQKSANTITVGKSDVDMDIPTITEVKMNTYALIIGNEDYSSFQTGLNTEVNVDFAMNDAKMFKEYCNKTLGIPEKQIKLLTNATSGQMNQGISWLNNLAKIDNGKAELIFYYSGHGLPDEQTKESYLMPVDISGYNVTQAVKLTDIYYKLNEHPSKKVTVFLDACFSGGARNQGLIAMKGVKIKPKENMVTGNMIVISSSTGEESSGVYRDKQHGFMTYFLLKKLQESKGNISYKELGDYIIENVKKETALSGKNQTPQLNYSPDIEGTWTNWKIK
jgi:hypothetical protein